ARRGVRCFLVAPAEPRERIQRRRFRRSHEIELDDALDVVIALCTEFHSFPGGLVFGAVFGFTGTSLGATSYSGFAAAISHRSNQPTRCCSRSMRCHGWPERDSSCVSFGNFTITVGILRNFSARNICSPPALEGVRVSVSP